METRTKIAQGSMARSHQAGPGKAVGRAHGWRAYHVESYQNWCGHAQEVLTWSQSDGSVLLIPVLGEAT